VKVHTACRVELVRDLPGFQKLQPEWNELLDRSPNNSITLTWEWLSTWWQVYGAGRELRIVAVYDDARLIGAASMLARLRANLTSVRACCCIPTRSTRPSPPATPSTTS
jgi:hypothetical protein